jgi:hypothetical protein
MGGLALASPLVPPLSSTHAHGESTALAQAYDTEAVEALVGFHPDGAKREIREKYSME